MNGEGPKSLRPTVLDLDNLLTCLRGDNSHKYKLIEFFEIYVFSAKVRNIPMRKYFKSISLFNFSKLNPQTFSCKGR